MTTLWGRDSCRARFIQEGQLGPDLLQLLSYDSHPLTAASVLLLLSPSSLSVSLISTPDQGAAAGAGWSTWQPPGPARAALPRAAAAEGGGWKLQPENGAGGWCPGLSCTYCNLSSLNQTLAAHGSSEAGMSGETCVFSPHAALVLMH